MDRLFTVQQSTLQAVVNYLTGRPWGEVNDLIAAIEADAKKFNSLPEETSAKEQDNGPASAEGEKDEQAPTGEL